MGIICRQFSVFVSVTGLQIKSVSATGAWIMLVVTAVIIERIFEIPGMGRLSLDAVAGRDYAVFMAILALTSTLQLLGNLLSDCCYMLIDPRITFSSGR